MPFSNYSEKGGVPVKREGGSLVNRVSWGGADTCPRSLALPTSSVDHGPLWLPSWILRPYHETAPDPRPRDGAAGRARTCELKPLPGERPPRTSVAGQPGWTRTGLVSWPVPLEMSPGNEELWEAGVTGPNTDTVLSPPNHPARGLRTAPWCGLLDLHCARMRKVVTVHTFLTGTPFRLQRSRLHRLPPGQTGGVPRRRANASSRVRLRFSGLGRRRSGTRPGSGPAWGPQHPSALLFSGPRTYRPHLGYVLLFTPLNWSVTRMGPLRSLGGTTPRPTARRALGEGRPRPWWSASFGCRPVTGGSSRDQLPLRSNALLPNASVTGIR